MQFNYEYFDVSLFGTNQDGEEKEFIADIIITEINHDKYTVEIDRTDQSLMERGIYIDKDDINQQCIDYHIEQRQAEYDRHNDPYADITKFPDNH